MTHTRPRSQQDSAGVDEATKSALREADSIRRDVWSCMYAMASIRPPFSPSYIRQTLSDVEQRIKVDRRDAAKITRKAASVAVSEVAGLIQEADTKLAEWRSMFPDTTPLRIDNRA